MTDAPEAIALQIRRMELEAVKKHVHVNRILDLGGGSGFMASLLRANGTACVSVDVPTNPFRGTQYAPVLMYDGRRIFSEPELRPGVFVARITVRRVHWSGL